MGRAELLSREKKKNHLPPPTPPTIQAGDGDAPERAQLACDRLGYKPATVIVSLASGKLTRDRSVDGTASAPLRAAIGEEARKSHLAALRARQSSSRGEGGPL